MKHMLALRLVDLLVEKEDVNEEMLHAFLKRYSLTEEGTVFGALAMAARRGEDGAWTLKVIAVASGGALVFGWMDGMKQTHVRRVWGFNRHCN